MKRVVTWVCGNFESGTDEPVVLRFRSTKFNSSGKYQTECHTHILDDKGKDDWSRSSTEVWGLYTTLGLDFGWQTHNFLGSCTEMRNVNFYTDNLSSKFDPETRNRDKN